MLRTRVVRGVVVARSESASQPLLRGWLHAVAGVVAAGFTLALVPYVVGDWLRLTTLLLYGLASVWLFACSAVYHIVTWSPSRLKVLRAVDRGNIYVVIAATCTAISGNVLDGWQRIVPLVAVWMFTLIGVTMTVADVRISAAPRVALYVLTGLTSALAAPALIASLPVEAIITIIYGALLYIVGGVVYALHQPDPFPRVFGYHEVFHLLVIAGSVVFGTVIWCWVLPLAVR
jgi:hemolysin III